MTGAGFSLFLAAALLGHAVQAKLPSATWGRTSAASVVTGDQWLLIGGSFRTFTTTAPGNAGYQQAREHLASTIAILDLERKRVRDEFVDPSPDGVNRMNSTGHSCAYSKSEETVYCFGKHFEFRQGLSRLSSRAPDRFTYFQAA
ncbi:hypothetical protein BC832DRAFT_346191 [Gaertneriomyces semiglobifer]|nr:hypothetical protein BC832DRAFT_346191 [Gaertneriomyces semiglobifer]